VPVTKRSSTRRSSGSTRRPIARAASRRSALPAPARPTPRAPRHLPPRWRRRKEERPGEILAAALEEFVDRGYAGCKLDSVARRAGVTKGTMYRYYRSKEALFKAMVRTSVVPHIADFEREISESRGTARELLVAFAQGWMGCVYRSPISGLAKLVMAESANFPELARFYQEEVIERMVRALTRMLERGMKSGEFRRLDMDSAARVLRSPLILIGIWKHTLLKTDPRGLDEEKFIETYLDMMLRGLLAPGAGARS